MKKIIYTFFLLFPILSWGQTQNVQNTRILTSSVTTTNSNKTVTEPSARDLYNKLIGTFEVEISQPNYQVLYTKDLLNMIQTSRKESEEVRFAWDAYTTIIVLPLNPVKYSSSKTSQN